MRATAEWLGGARGWIAVAVLAATLAGALVAATHPRIAGRHLDRIGELAARPNSLPSRRQNRYPPTGQRACRGP
jgi:hypothetical protein